VYVYYEHRNPSTPLEMLDLALSSDGRTTKIDWKNPKEVAQSEIIRSLLKAKQFKGDFSLGLLSLP